MYLLPHKTTLWTSYIDFKAFNITIISIKNKHSLMEEKVVKQ